MFLLRGNQMIKQFIFCGSLGWCFEVFWTCLLYTSPQHCVCRYCAHALPRQEVSFRHSPSAVSYTHLEAGFNARTPQVSMSFLLFLTFLSFLLFSLFPLLPAFSPAALPCLPASLSCTSILASKMCIRDRLPGAWLANWLHGKSNISRPLSWNSS